MTVARPQVLSLLAIVMLGPTGCSSGSRRRVPGLSCAEMFRPCTSGSRPRRRHSRRIDQLQRVFDDASALLTRSSTDLGNAIAELRSEVRETANLAAVVKTSVTELEQGVSSVMRTRIDRIEVRIAQAESGKATGRSSPEELWTLASQAFEVKR